MMTYSCTFTLFSFSLLRAYAQTNETLALETIAKPRPKGMHKNSFLILLIQRRKVNTKIFRNEI